MSKQKTQELEPETEKEVTGNPVEQTELEGLAAEETKPETIDVAQEVNDVVKPETRKEKKLDPRINTVATASVKANRKMGVYNFLSLYPQDIYISTLLKHYYPRSFFTKDEWFQRINELLNTPINN